MRRHRSETIEASNFNELLKLSQIPKTSYPRSRNRKSLPESCLIPQCLPQKSSPLIEEADTTPDDYKEPSKPGSNNVDYWNEMDFNCQELSPKSSATTTSGSITSFYQSSTGNESVPQSIFDDDIDETKFNQFQVMIVGAKGTGRHMMVDTLLKTETEEHQKHGIRTSFDLIVKKSQAEGQKSVDLYKFWIKDAEKTAHDYLFKTYYKSVGVYVFMYQVADRSSFECLDRVITHIKQEKRGEKFLGVLVGGRQEDQKNTEDLVSYAEGEELCRKHDLCKFIEQDFKAADEQICLTDILAK